MKKDAPLQGCIFFVFKGNGFRESVLLSVAGRNLRGKHSEPSPGGGSDSRGSGEPHSSFSEVSQCSGPQVVPAKNFHSLFAIPRLDAAMGLSELHGEGTSGDAGEQQ